MKGQRDVRHSAPMNKEHKSMTPSSTGEAIDKQDVRTIDIAEQLKMCRWDSDCHTNESNHRLTKQ